MTTSLRVTHIVAPGAVGGLESVVAMLASGMARRGHRIRILALLEPEGRCDAFTPLTGDGVEVVEVRFPAGSYLAEAARLAALLGEAPGSVAHTHGYHADLVGLRAARRARCQVVSTVHGFTGGGLKNRCYEWMDRAALRRFDGVIAVSQPLQARLSRAGIPSARVHLIPNAYPPPPVLPDRAEARQRLGIPADALVAGWVGRLSREKGPDVFLAALALAPEWAGSVIGDGPQGPALRQQARALGIESRLRWHGQLPGAGCLLRAFDALVLSSRTEGTPIVLLEGMAAGTPIVATAVGGVPDVVTGREAAMVPPELPEAVAEALRLIRLDPPAAAARARAAAERLAASHAIPQWLDRHEAVYRGLPGVSSSRMGS